MSLNVVEKSTLLGIEGEDQGINCSSRELVLPYPTKMDVKRISSLLFSNFWVSSEVYSFFSILYFFKGQILTPGFFLEQY